MTTDTNTNATETESRNARQTITALVTSGVSPTASLDIYMVVEVGMPPAVWADLRGVTERAVNQNVDRAADVLDEVGL